MMNRVSIASKSIEERSNLTHVVSEQRSLSGSETIFLDGDGSFLLLEGGEFLL